MNIVIFRATDSMVEALDCVAGELCRTRSALIREAIAQRITFYEKHEREIVHALRKQAADFYGNEGRD